MRHWGSDLQLYRDAGRVMPTAATVLKVDAVMARTDRGLCPECAQRMVGGERCPCWESGSNADNEVVS